MLKPVRQRQALLCGVERGSQEEELRGVADQIGDEADRHGVLGARVLLVARRREPPQYPQPRPDGDGHDPRDQPVRQRIAEQQALRRLDLVRKVFTHDGDFDAPPRPYQWTGIPSARPRRPAASSSQRC